MPSPLPCPPDPPDLAPAREGPVWTAVALGLSLPVLITLAVVLWRTPYPVSEAVALFEDAARFPPSHFLAGDTAYYRPLYHLALGWIWRHAGPLDVRLAWVTALHVVPVVVLVVALVVHLRPRSAGEAGAAALAAAVLVGSPGLRDNLEIPLAYTAVGMPLALLAWMLLTGRRRPWTGAAVLALAVVAVGFKEQGLVIVPLVLVAWATRAPGASRALLVALLAATVAYLAFRVASREHWDGFEQAVGIGFREIEPREANARFGAFPYPVYAYNAAATMASVLFSEPTRGVFGITWMIGQRQARPWEYLHLLSSLALTTLIAWWCVDRLRATVRAGWAWSPESRAALALAGVLLACGALSFNYSRDRLGGMAAPFYAASAYFAVRAAADRALAASRARLVATGLLLCALGVAWQMRAIGTIEYSRFVAARNQFEWLTQPASRRKDFADRPVYLDIMNAMVAQGVVPDAPRPTRYPHWATRLISLPWDTNICSSVADGTCWPR